MESQKSLLSYLAEWWETRSAKPTAHLGSRFLPTPGNMFFTLLVAALLVLTQQTWASPNMLSTSVGPSATTINYQGRLAAPDGTPEDGTFGMEFAIWDAQTGGNIVWGPESHTAVAVSNGLFNIGLGSKSHSGIPTTVWGGDRYLEIAVEGEPLSPRELIRSVPVAGMALTVPDGSITADKLSSSATDQWIMANDEQSIIKVNGQEFDYQTIDISSLISPHTTAIYVKSWLTTRDGTGVCRIRPSGSTSTGSIVIFTSASNQTNASSGLVAVNDGKIEYACSLNSGATIIAAGIGLWGYQDSGH